MQLVLRIKLLNMVRRMIHCPFIFAGCFYVPEIKDESVLGMCSDPDNKILITGDTQGDIAVWDISQYCTAPAEKVH